jgi:hypothetical protein
MLKTLILNVNLIKKNNIKYKHWINSKQKQTENSETISIFYKLKVI